MTSVIYRLIIVVGITLAVVAAIFVYQQKNNTDAVPQTQPPTSKSIGYAGCSITIQTVEGYRELGEQGMWPPEQGFDDGSVFNWNNPRGSWRDAFNKCVI